MGEKGLGGAEVQNIVLQTVAEWRNAKILLCMLRNFCHCDNSSYSSNVTV